MQRLELSFNESEARWDVPDLIQLLSGAPLLERLRLVGILAKAPRPDTAERTVSLPSLEKLELHVHRNDIHTITFARDLLAQIVLPDRCHVLTVILTVVIQS